MSVNNKLFALDINLKAINLNYKALPKKELKYFVNFFCKFPGFAGVQISQTNAASVCMNTLSIDHEVGHFPVSPLCFWIINSYCP